MSEHPMRSEDRIPSEHPIPGEDQILGEDQIASEYPIRIGPRSRLFLRFFFGVRPGHDVVRLEDGMIEIRFGWFSPRFPVSQLVHWRIEGPWLWITAIGVRLSLRHRDLSFAGSPRGGVRMDLEPRYSYGPLSIPAFYVGVEDLDGFAAKLGALGIPGEDARRS